MTPLRKPIHRLCTATRAFGRDRHRVVVVSLAPGDVIEFRAQGTRKRYTLAIAAAFGLAVKQEGARMIAERTARRKAKREGRTP